MLLALTLGMSIGVKKAMYMMWGELLGVAVVACSAALGVAAIILKLPEAFIVLKLVGGAYLIWLGYQMWCSRGKLVLNTDNETPQQKSLDLAINGFITAIANPKGWAFFITLLPTFLVTEAPLAPQLTLMIAVILILEFICLMLYATGGKALRHLLLNKNNADLVKKHLDFYMVGKPEAEKETEA